MATPVVVKFMTLARLSIGKGGIITPDSPLASNALSLTPTVVGVSVLINFI